MEYDMSKGDPGLFIEYCAKDFFEGTEVLGPWEELAYRRICDMIYKTNNNLRDDDRMLAWATKAGRRWAKIKIALTTGDKPKLEIINGLVTNKRCTEALGKAAQLMTQKAQGGRASAATGKSLKNLKPFRTGVLYPVLENTEQDTEQDTELTNNPITHIESPNGLSHSSAAIRARELESEFEEIWKMFPRKKSKADALKAFISARKSTELAVIEDGINRFRGESEGKEPRYIAHPASWLNGKRWLDEDAKPNGYTNGHSMFDTGPTEPPPEIEGFEVRPVRPH